MHSLISVCISFSRWTVALNLQLQTPKTSRIECLLYICLAHNAEKILKILEMNMCVRFRVTNKPVSLGSVIRCSCWYICAYISRCCCLNSYTIRFLSCVSLMFILFKSLPFIKFSNASSAICIVYTLTHNILTMWKYIWNSSSSNQI